MNSTLREIIRERKLREMGISDDQGSSKGTAAPMLQTTGRRQSTLVELAEKPVEVAKQWIGIILDMMKDANGGGVHIIECHPESFPIIMCYYIAFFTTWAVVVYLLTVSGQAQIYLSAQGSGSGQICTELPKTVTATYQGDIYGNWETNAAFNQNSSVFMIQFVGSKISSAQYVATMTSFKQQLLDLSRKSTMRDSAWNAVMWSSFLFEDSNNNDQYIHPSKYYRRHQFSHVIQIFHHH